jgi:hypothetical protein
LDVDHILFAIELSFDQEEFAAFDDGLIVFEEILAHNDAEDYRRIRRSSFQREAATNENRCSRYSSRGLPWDDLEVNLAGPFTSGTLCYSGGRLMEI